MSGVARTLGKISGIAAAVLSVVGSPYAIAFAANAAIMNTVATITAKKPPILGTASNITIGADQLSPYMMGDCYSGGAMAHKVGYGPEIDKVKNPYLAMAVTYSLGGPIAGIDSYYADFEPLSFSGDGAAGYFAGILYRKASLGPLLQSTALTGPWGAISQWGADAKLSGKAHVLYSAKWDSKNGKFNAGLPQLGIRGRGVLTWDPRADSTWPGGSGAHRWSDPANRSAFDAARATWAYSFRPGLHGLRYALGTWERDLNNPTSNYVLTFGVGLRIDQIVVEDFAELENICEANDWEVSGVIYEPGDKWANLKRILEAGGAEPCWKGGRLGLKVTAPRVALDTIEMEDLAGPIRAQGCAAWRERINTVIPGYTSPAHKWTLQQLTKISIPDLVAEDGEEKPGPADFELVKVPTQASQLALYQLFATREFGPVELPVQPRLRHYRGGDRLRLADTIVEQLGIPHGEMIVLQRSFDPGTMTGTLTLMGETASKHAAAMSATGIAPPAIVIPTTEDRDGALTVPPEPTIEQLLIASSYPIPNSIITAVDAGASATISVAAHSRVYQDRTVAVHATSITGMAYATTYWLYADDPDRLGGAVTAQATTTYADAFTSSAHPARHHVGWILTPAAGAGGSTGGGGTPPGGGGGNPIP